MALHPRTGRHLNLKKDKKGNRGWVDFKSKLFKLQQEAAWENMLERMEKPQAMLNTETGELSPTPKKENYKFDKKEFQNLAETSNRRRRGLRAGPIKKENE